MKSDEQQGRLDRLGILIWGAILWMFVIPVFHLVVGIIEAYQRLTSQEDSA